MNKILYDIADHPLLEDWAKFGMEKLPFSDRMRLTLDLRAITTGEFRSPKKGEWYLSGAIIQAYRAPNNLSTNYHIAKLVLTETKTTTTIKVIKKS